MGWGGTGCSRGSAKESAETDGVENGEYGKRAAYRACLQSPLVVISTV